MGNISVVGKPVTLTDLTATINTINDNTIVAAPGAGLRIVVHELTIQQASATATTIIVKSGTTSKRTIPCLSQIDGFCFAPESGKEMRCGANEALILNLSVAQNVTYTLRYTVEAA